jgi:hypothetical protein
MQRQRWIWTLVVVAIAVLISMAYEAASMSLATVAPVDVEDRWLCVGPMGNFRESFEVPGSSLALTIAGNPLVMAPTVKMPPPLDVYMANMAGRDFRRCW